MKENAAPKSISREEYREPMWNIEHVSLQFDLVADATTVHAEMRVVRNDNLVQPTPADSTPNESLVLDGVELELLDLQIDGRQLAADDYDVDECSLTLFGLPDAFVLLVVTRINPLGNKALEGLYQSSGNFCTQCEAQGFRKITYFQDRPDVLAVFDVKLIADKSRYPVLLANGNLVEQGVLDDGRHWALWNDPFPKPSYLFALVAGALEFVQDSFETSSGRKVDLRIYVESHNIEKCDYAMESLKKSMLWDEQVFGLEYDLDIFMIVAVDDFNMGAMENKGLNIFNSKFVLADRETATDADFKGVEGVIAHEYFHNWTGNRVTCRDWFQLSLKEGLTVFRDQEFSADMNSRAVKRIADVRLLKARQFPEDAGPMAHPIRPDSYIEINNFYTVTVYEKGAEVIRMIHTLLGAGKFRQGVDLYFKRFDGQAVTCEDFVQAMEDASANDLTQFRHWYSQAGTPELTVSSEYFPDTAQFHLHVSQACPATPGQPDKPEFHLPMLTALIDPAGRSLPLSGSFCEGGKQEVVLDVRLGQQTFVFENVTTRPVPSLLRGFSAPVHLHYDYSFDELAFLMANDSDTFNRWDAGQRLVKRVIENRVHSNVAGVTTDEETDAEREWVASFGKLLADESIDAALKAEMLSIPGIESIAQTHEVIDIDGIERARTELMQELAGTHEELLMTVYKSSSGTSSDPSSEQVGFSLDSASMGRRSLANASLQLLSKLPVEKWLALATTRFETADNMTDLASTLQLICCHDVPQRDECLNHFYKTWTGNKLVIDKWFTIQALSTAGDATERVLQLRSHPAFTLENPNRVRSLIGAFAMSNTMAFHAIDGSGYSLLTDVILELDGSNPQVAARLAGALSGWRRYDAVRQQFMKNHLKQIVNTTPLSPDVFEIVSKSLE